MTLTLGCLLSASPAAAGGGKGPKVPSTACTPYGATLPAPAPQTSSPLTFGIYSGGGAGTVAGGGQTKAVDPVKRLAALQQLRSSQPFVVHLYLQYNGDPVADAAAPWVADEVADVTAAGMQAELVLTYRPQRRDAAVDVPGFAQFGREVVKRYGANRSVVSLQVTNEANVPGQPDASDGDFPGVRDALVQGVIAVAGQATAQGADHVRVGFNVAMYGSAATQRDWFADLRARGGAPFTTAVDWVGLDIYPGTWSALRTGVSTSDGVRGAMVEALHLLRSCHMPAAGLDDRVAIQVSENGYPTDAGLRTFSAQETSMRAAVGAVSDYRTSFGVTDYRWFDLRDADSSGGMEARYGIMTDDYTPKPAFFAYKELVARLGALTPVPTSRLARLAFSSRVVAKMTRLAVQTPGGRVLGRLRARPLPRTVCVLLPRGTRLERVRVVLHGRRTHRARRAMVRTTSGACAPGVAMVTAGRV